MDVSRKNSETKKETCSQCGGQGFHEFNYYISHDGVDHKGKRYSSSSTEIELVGCSDCGGSGSFPKTKMYDNSIFSSAQSRYDRDFSQAVKKGCGKVVVTRETFPWEDAGNITAQWVPMVIGLEQYRDGLESHLNHNLVMGIQR